VSAGRALAGTLPFRTRIRARMQVFVALTVGLVIWIVLWAAGAKPFDAFLIPAFLVVMAATMRIAQPYLNKLLKP
jgi:hypothetical protein